MVDVRSRARRRSIVAATCPIVLQTSVNKSRDKAPLQNSVGNITIMDANKQAYSLSEAYVQSKRNYHEIISLFTRLTTTISQLQAELDTLSQNIQFNRNTPFLLNSTVSQNERIRLLFSQMSCLSGKLGSKAVLYPASGQGTSVNGATKYPGNIEDGEESLLSLAFVQWCVLLCPINL